MRRKLRISGCCLHHEELWPEVNQQHLHLRSPDPLLLMGDVWHLPQLGCPISCCSATQIKPFPLDSCCDLQDGGGCAGAIPPLPEP